jgi:hypothetical protein
MIIIVSPIEEFPKQSPTLLSLDRANKWKAPGAHPRQENHEASTSNYRQPVTLLMLLSFH